MRVHNEKLRVQSVCVFCNLHKGPNLAGVDPRTGAVERLFDPRQDPWETHFERRGVLILGLTPSGRATIAVLDMNSEPQLDLRRACESHETRGESS
jgi:hypothetical protein